MEKEKNARHYYSCRHFCRYFTMGAKNLLLQITVEIVLTGGEGKRNMIFL